MVRKLLFFLPNLLFLSINQAVGNIAVGYAAARSYIALSLHYLGLRTERRRPKNKEEGIMDWVLLSIGTLTAVMSVFALHFIWRESH